MGVLKGSIRLLGGSGDVVGKGMNKATIPILTYNPN